MRELGEEQRGAFTGRREEDLLCLWPSSGVATEPSGASLWDPGAKGSVAEAGETQGLPGTHSSAPGSTASSLPPSLCASGALIRNNEQQLLLLSTTITPKWSMALPEGENSFRFCVFVQLCLHNPVASGAHWWWEMLMINGGVMEDV